MCEPSPRCLLQAIQALVQSYYLPEHPTATLSQTHVNFFLHVRLHESLPNHKWHKSRSSSHDIAVNNRILDTAAVGPNIYPKSMLILDSSPALQFSPWFSWARHTHQLSNQKPTVKIHAPPNTFKDERAPIACPPCSSLVP